MLAGSEAATSLISTLTRIRGPSGVPVTEVALLSACPLTCTFHDVVLEERLESMADLEVEYCQLQPLH